MTSNRIPVRSVHLRPDKSAVANRPVGDCGVGALKIDRIRYAEISPEIERFWLGMHRADEQLRSPNFHPDFTKAVAAIREDVEIALIRSANGHLLGLFPYQRWGEHAVDPIGGRMNDYHGILLSRRLKLDLETLLHKLNIRRFCFHALSANRACFENFKFDSLPSYSVNLSEGYRHYLQSVTARSQTLKRLPQKIRALQRDHGPIRFEFECHRAELLQKLIELKSKKYVRTNTFDILSVDWAANLLREIHGYQSADFRGILSVLWAGDSIAAAHFGMIAGDVMQYWFPVYDDVYAKYSPGLQLMMQTIRSAGEAGIKAIDLSYGQSKFKELFANEVEEVWFGQVQFNPISFGISKQRYLIRKRLKDIPFKQAAKSGLRKIFPGYGRWHFK